MIEHTLQKLTRDLNNKINNEKIKETEFYSLHTSEKNCMISKILYESDSSAL